MSKPDVHGFNIDLPLHPSFGEPVSLLMDGKALEGVKELTIRAGANGFTNIVVNFDARVAIKMTAGLLANIDLDEEDRTRLLGGLFDETVFELCSNITELDSDLKQQFIINLNEKLIEKLT